MDQWAEQLRSFGWVAVLVGVAAIALQTIVPVVPYLVLAGANIIVFGMFKGYIINWIGAVLGALIAFGIARRLGQQRIQERWKCHPRVQWFNRQLERRGFFILLFVRVIPIVPPSAVNMVSGVSLVPLRTYAAATILGKIPSVWLGSMIGHDLFRFEEYKLRLAALTAVVLLIAGIGMIVKRRWIR